MAGETVGYEPGFRLIRAKDGSIVKEPARTDPYGVPIDPTTGLRIVNETVPHYGAGGSAGGAGGLSPAVTEVIPRRDKSGRLIPEGFSSPQIAPQQQAQASSPAMQKVMALIAALRARSAGQ